MEHSADLAIIGAGPIGIELAVAVQRAGLKYVHFDASQVGHTISWFAPQTRFFSSNERIAIAGVPLQTPDQAKATREQYLSYLRAVVMQFDLEIKTYQPVTAIRKTGGGFELTTRTAGRQDEVYAVRKLVLATGGTARPRTLNIPGEDLPHVSHYFQDPHAYFRKRVLIVGGKNSAVEAALRCQGAGAEVIFCYRGEKLDPSSIKYWLLPEINGLLKSNRIRGLFRYQPAEIAPARVVLRRLDTSETIDVNPDFVLLMIGYEADMSLCRMAGVDLRTEGQAPVYDEQTMETNVPGLYLAGTVVGGTQDKYRVFIENCHVHVDRIVASLTGHAPPPEPSPFERPES
jgi:thioredoxin reductase (NADPH)